MARVIAAAIPHDKRHPKRIIMTPQGASFVWAMGAVMRPAPTPGRIIERWLGRPLPTDLVITRHSVDGPIRRVWRPEEAS